MRLQEAFDNPYQDENMGNKRGEPDLGRLIPAAAEPRAACAVPDSRTAEHAVANDTDIAHAASAWPRPIRIHTADCSIFLFGLEIGLRIFVYDMR